MSGTSPRILLVNQNWLGDVLFSTPAIRALRKKFPEGFIACLVPERCRQALAQNPYLDEVIVYDERAFLFSWKTLRLVAALRRRRFDKAIFLHRSRTKVRLARWAGIPERWGYASKRGQRDLTRAVPVPVVKSHKTDFFLKLLEDCGIPADGRTTDFFPKKEAEGELKELFDGLGIALGAPYAVVHAGGNWELKRWPADFFVRWARIFLKKYPWRIILCGTARETALCNSIASSFKNGELVPVCGKTSLDALALLLKNAKILVSNDSGPIHLAASQNTKILGLFGPTSPDETGPVSAAPLKILRKDVGCDVPCYYRSCNYRVCMEWLTPEEVFAATEELLNAHPR